MVITSPVTFAEPMWELPYILFNLIPSTPYVGKGEFRGYQGSASHLPSDKDNPLNDD
jgi:hypothetical protein